MPVAHNIGGVGDAQGPGSWFQSLPIITKAWFGASLVTTLAVNFQIIPGGQIIWNWNAVLSQFEIWRIITCFLFIGKFEFNTLIALMLLVQFSERYEKGGPFNTGAGGGTADYCFMLMFFVAITLLSYPLMIMIAPIPPIFARNMIYGVLYIWSKRNPTSQANIWGIPVPSIYLPFAYVAMTVFMGGSYMDMLHGMAIAHIYYFLADVVPQVQGYDIIITPQFLIDYFGIGQYQPSTQPTTRSGSTTTTTATTFGQQQSSTNTSSSFGGGGNRGGGHNWGSGGQRLGRD